MGRSLDGMGSMGGGSGSRSGQRLGLRFGNVVGNASGPSVSGVGCRAEETAIVRGGAARLRRYAPVLAARGVHRHAVGERAAASGRRRCGRGLARATRQRRGAMPARGHAGVAACGQRTMRAEFRVEIAQLREDLGELRKDVAQLRERIAGLESRMSRLEGLFEGFTQRRPDAAE